jgi:hypothetical protein
LTFVFNNVEGNTEKKQREGRTKIVDTAVKIILIIAENTFRA